MTRVVVALALGLFALAGIPAEAATSKRPATQSAKKPTKKVAKKKKATKKRASKRQLAKAKKRKRSRSDTAGVKIARTPEVAIASHHGDGRVKYGRDNMPPGFAWPPTKAMVAATKSCEQSLETLGITWQPAPPLGRIVAPIRVPAMEIAGIKYTSTYQKGAQTWDCQLVHTLAVIGTELHKLGVREVRFGSIYRNTKVRVHGQRKNILSRHALGLAMDIKSFVDETGRVASVEMDYLKGDPLLHAIEDTINQSTRFRIVLTPGNDPLSHYDHFHIEASVDFTAFR